jgi:hypothetical protein
MLDSLVRVSRRVGGAANLLTTRCSPCQTWTHAIHDCSFTRQLQSPEHRARSQGTNFTYACGLMPAVRRVKYRRSAAANNTNSNVEILRHSNTTAELPSTWTSGTDFEKPLRLPLYSFTYYWTLSSKFFSTFPHGTCSLSVSGSYLALRRVYDALWAALPSNPTLEKSQNSKSSVVRAYHPLRAMAPVKVDLDWTTRCHEAFPNTTFHATEIIGGSVLGFYRFIRHY